MANEPHKIPPAGPAREAWLDELPLERARDDRAEFGVSTCLRRIEAMATLIRGLEFEIAEIRKAAGPFARLNAHHDDCWRDADDRCKCGLSFARERLVTALSASVAGTRAVVLREPDARRVLWALHTFNECDPHHPDLVAIESTIRLRLAALGPAQAGETA